ncbi:unnamed protein product [Acanthoscelides obtectus]|nr:unnamed protein product [Acanthoscelides obtectus]CAK1621278.1 Sorting nexin-21 [Acanthoscelides obtectus]
MSPSVVERRYTHFLNLYNALKKEHPQLMSTVVFPKKVLIGNFDNDLISTRSTGFESLLNHISTESRLRTSKSLLDFLQDTELSKAKEFIKKEDYITACPILENNFKLLNKIFTDRSPAVLLALCRLVACLTLLQDFPNSLKWADLALHRYEGVSDSDLLELYVPLLNACSKIWWQNGRNKEELEKRIEELRKKGHRVDGETNLMEAVDSVESRIFGEAR